MKSTSGSNRGAMFHQGRAAMLRRLLAEVVHHEPSLQAAARLVMKPVDKLAVLSGAAPGALADMPWKGQVVRAVLEAHQGHGISREKARELLGSQGEWPAPTAGGLLHMGELVIVALAAVRLGAAQGVAAEYLDRVFNLALVTGVAESLHRLAGTPSDNRVTASAMLDMLCGPDKGCDMLQSACIRLMVSDPAERMRWALLIRLFEELARDTNVTRKNQTAPWWVGVDPGFSVRGFTPERCPPGERLKVYGSFTDTEPLSMVFASLYGGDAPSATCAPLIMEAARDTSHAVVTVPENTGPGWIGVLSPTAVRSANRARETLRERWTELSAQLLPSTPVPTERIAALDPERSLPPWPFSLPFDGGYPILVHASVHPDRANPGSRVRVEWEAKGSDWVEIAGRSKRRPIAGCEELRLPLAPGPWSVKLEPVALSHAKRRLRGQVSILTIEPREEADR